MGNLKAVRWNAKTVCSGSRRGGVMRRCVTSVRGSRITWCRERLSVMLGIWFCVVMLAFMLAIGLAGGGNYEDALKWLCYWCAAIAALSAHSVGRLMICHGVSRRTILFVQWVGNACIAAGVSVVLTVSVGLSHMLFSNPWRQGVHASRLEVMAGYPYALSWTPRFTDEADRALQWRTGWPYWTVFLLLAFMVLFAVVMVGQLVGEICSHLGAARSIVVGLVSFMVVTLVVQIVGYDVVDRLVAASLGFVQRGSTETRDWAVAYSVWPLLVTMVVVSAVCMAATAWLTTRREVRPPIAR